MTGGLKRRRATTLRRLAVLSWRCRDLVFPPRMVARARGITITLQRDNAMTRMRAVTFESKEPGTLDWLDALKPGEMLFDVGANVGVYTLYAAKRGIRVVALEPEWSNLHYLRDNIILNGLRREVQVVGVALSDVTDLTTLHLHDTLPGSAVHTESRTPRDVTAVGTPVVFGETMWSVRLDDLCERLGLWPDAIKIDVDGTEPTILRGAPRALRRVRTLLVERHGFEGDPAAAAMLTEGGLVEAGRDRESVIWERGAAPTGDARREA
jgi:FkbM family methyltransferase